MADRRFLVKVDDLSIDALDEFETVDFHRTYFGKNPFVMFEVRDESVEARVEVGVRVGAEVFPFVGRVPKATLQGMTDAYFDKHGQFPPFLVKQRFILHPQVFLDWYEFPEERHVVVVRDLDPWGIYGYLPTGLQVLEEITDDAKYREENLAGRLG